MELKGFFRARVVFNEDTQLSGIIGVDIPEITGGNSSDKVEYDHTKENEQSNMLFLRPTTGYSEAKFDYEKYGTFSGSYSAPRIGSYIIAFFLNSDITQGFYLPDMTLPYMDQKASGYNLDNENKKDFFDKKRKPNIWLIKEFHNRNIVGFNNNYDKQEFFFTFDNGAEIRFASPNKGDGVFETNDNPSFFLIDIKRHDSELESSVYIDHNNSETSIQLRTNKDSEISHDNDYDKNKANQNTYESSIALKSTLNSSKISTLIKSTTDIENASLYAENKVLDDNSINISTNISNKRYENRKFRLDNTKNIGNGSIHKHDNIEYVDTPNVTSYTLTDYVDVAKYKMTQMISHVFQVTKNIIFRNNRSTVITTSQIENTDKIEGEFINSTTNQSSYHVIDERRYVNKDVAARTIQHRIDDTIISSNTRMEKGLATNNISDSKEFKNGNSIVRYSTSNDGSTSSISHEVLYGGYAPVDFSKKFPLAMNGHKVSTTVSSTQAITKIESVHSGTTDAAKYNNLIEYKESAGESTITIDIKGNNPSGGIKLVLSTNGSGAVTLDIPQGDITVKSSLGNMNVDMGTGNITNKANTKKETYTDLEVAVLNAIKSSGAIFESDYQQATLNGAILEIINDSTKITASSIFQVSSPLIKLGDSATSPVFDATVLLAWLMTHTHVSASPGSPTTPSPLPMPANVIKTNVLV